MNKFFDEAGKFIECSIPNDVLIWNEYGIEKCILNVINQTDFNVPWSLRRDAKNWLAFYNINVSFLPAKKSVNDDLTTYVLFFVLNSIYDGETFEGLKDENTSI